MLTQTAGGALKVICLLLFALCLFTPLCFYLGNCHFLRSFVGAPVCLVFGVVVGHMAPLMSCQNTDLQKHKRSFDAYLSYSTKISPSSS